jgi:hypothetical protein
VALGGQSLPREEFLELADEAAPGPRGQWVELVPSASRKFSKRLRGPSSEMTLGDVSPARAGRPKDGVSRHRPRGDGMDRDPSHAARWTGGASSSRGAAIVPSTEARPIRSTALVALVPGALEPRRLSRG